MQTCLPPTHQRDTQAHLGKGTISKDQIFGNLGPTAKAPATLPERQATVHVLEVNGKACWRVIQFVTGAEPARKAGIYS